MALIDKPAAAERMIVSAIAMSERGDDPLAIHVVASSALNLLRELIEKSGDNYVAQVLKLGVFTMAAARAKGEPVTLPTNPDIDALIDSVAAGIEAGEVNQPSDLTIALSTEALRDMIGYIIRPFNFLKHAQRDPLATLDEADVDADGAIGHALTAFTLVCPGKPLPDQIKPFLERHGLG
ncbi:hypothetical protein DAH66_15395 [Sphingomonas koreensis]|uniref:Uncharacterized protein n=2 Tax=Sphingomonas koreensis TaxID=93064 RepID=A0A430G1F2_9SPHN|nr:hypothetical protein DAH66_15395 [Sphingomonas koreensis]